MWIKAIFFLILYLIVNKNGNNKANNIQSLITTSANNVCVKLQVVWTRNKRIQTHVIMRWTFFFLRAAICGWKTYLTADEVQCSTQAGWLAMQLAWQTSCFIDTRGAPVYISISVVDSNCGTIVCLGRRNSSYSLTKCMQISHNQFDLQILILKMQIFNYNSPAQGTKKPLCGASSITKKKTKKH